MNFPFWYFALLCFVLGLFMGSFFNVCIYRIPRRKSIVYPPSACPKCRAPIAFYDNIPIISFLVLRGRCRKCAQPISLRYPTVELLTALLFLALAFRFGLSSEFLRGLIFTGLLIVLGFIDLDTKTIPDVVSLPGIALGLATSFLLAPAASRSSLHPFILALIGGGTGAVVVFLFRGLWLLVVRKEGLGQGDIFLAALMGSFLGWRLVLLSVFVGALLGVVIGAGIAAVRRKRVFGRYIPFGPYLAAAGLVALFFGDAILRWYWALFRH